MSITAVVADKYPNPAASNASLCGGASSGDAWTMDNASQKSILPSQKKTIGQRFPQCGERICFFVVNAKKSPAIFYRGEGAGDSFGSELSAYSGPFRRRP